jgi:cell division protein FtsB
LKNSMIADIESQDRFYRRGLVLGLTMAEIVVLVLFALLLALASLIAAKERRMQELAAQTRASEQRVAALSSQAATLNEQVNALLRASQGERNSFDELFRELELAKQQAEKVPGLVAEMKNLQQEAQAHRELFQMIKEAGNGESDPQKVVRDLVAKAAEADELKKMIDGAGKPEADPKETLRDLIGKAAAFGASGSGSQDPSRVIGDLTQKVQEGERQLEKTEAERRSLEGQNKNLRQILERIGTEWPACWASPETGKPEYIFDVALTTTGLIVRDNALPGRAHEQRQLPIGSITFGVELSHNDFLTAAAPLRKWSDERKCRFFVQAFDVTGPAEKAQYKHTLRILGQRFYHYEVLDRSFYSVR